MDVQPVGVLLVEDNEDDIVIMREALAEARLMNMIHVVRDGEEALEYLRRRGKYKDAERPGLILLDINMPKKNGFEVLEEIKADPALQAIPLVMLTVSDQEADVIKSYAKGACSYIRKPVNFEGLRDVVKHFELYWTLVSRIPSSEVRPMRVLLIEDNPDDAVLIRDALAMTRGEPISVECVERLSTGLARLASGGIDVILLDLSLPDSEGLGTFTKVYAQVPEVPIIVLTGLDDDAVAVKAVQQGAQDYLVKGQVIGSILVRAIRYAIERHRLQERPPNPVT